MDLLKALQETPLVRTGAGCSIRHVLNNVDNADEVEKLLCDPMRSAAGMARVLQQAGFQVGAGTITRHRRGECKCKKS